MNVSEIAERLGCDFDAENNGRKLVGAVGVEPTTNGLKGRCSTTELRSYIAETYYKKMIFDAWMRARCSQRSENGAQLRTPIRQVRLESAGEAAI
jgi:hypothetical protein